MTSQLLSMIISGLGLLILGLMSSQLQSINSKIDRHLEADAKIQEENAIQQTMQDADIKYLKEAMAGLRH